ncbi:acyl-CoA esterase [Nitzschia inconspicua]|uniref:Acyl-CoA esterase n=1 Tax=Nitzschia inconspicua TaxID=303405 RepID=A0A9K3LDT2_9STRA|nr:acyl-CoA esterase [Nitzschia inconspicua]
MTLKDRLPIPFSSLRTEARCSSFPPMALNQIIWKNAASSLFLRSLSTRSPIEPMKLHVEWLEAQKQNESDSSGKDDDNKTDRYSILFLHGLLGNGRNLKTFARTVVKQRDPFCHGGILMDLPGHGKSYDLAKTDQYFATGAAAVQQKRSYTFQQCVQDNDYTLRELHQDQLDAPAAVVVGHSWGGRLALEYAAASSTNGTPLKALWLLDTVPGQTHESVDRVIAAVSNIVEDGQDTNRKDLVEKLTRTHGLELGLAQWLASSYNPETKDFGFDLDLVQNLKPEFANQDFMGLLRVILERNDKYNTPGKSTQVHLVRGGKNAAWSVNTLAELEKLSQQFPNMFHLHVLPTAGHWVHVDDLPGLVALFERHS